MIAVTQIVNSFPCSRKAFLGAQYKNLTGQFNYALVLGNIVHSIFQSILQELSFKQEAINLIVNSAIKSQILLLFSLKMSEHQV